MKHQKLAISFTTVTIILTVIAIGFPFIYGDVKEKSQSKTTPQSSTTSPPKISPCDENPCLFNGTCSSESFCEASDCNNRCRNDLISCRPLCETDYCLSICAGEYEKCLKSCGCENDSENLYECSCKTGFSGENCEITPCDSNPCKNGGKCKIEGNSFLCRCPYGYSGEHCENDPCFDKCENGGKCSIHGSSFSCKCPYGYKGERCEYDPCDGIICEHDGVCSIDGSSYQCQCPEGYYGKLCEFTPCSSQPCYHGGVCSVNQSSYKCDCRPGYSGTNCEVTPCDEHLCENSGKCLISGDSYKCKCPNGYSGEFCQEDPCFTEPCENDGICEVDGSMFNCECQPGFSGDTCEITPCTENPCKHGGECAVSGDSFLCTCQDGFEGIICDITPCSTDSCENGGTCIFLKMGHQILSHAFVLIITTVTDVKSLLARIISAKMIPHAKSWARTIKTPCSGNPCKHGGECSINGDSFICYCQNGFEGPTCETTPCSSNPCQNDGVCRFTEDGSSKEFQCDCLLGYSGETCEEYICDPNPCDNDGTCQPAKTQSGFSCTCLGDFSGHHCGTHPCEGYVCNDHHQSCSVEDYKRECFCENGWYGSECQSDNPCFEKNCEGDKICFLDRYDIAKCVDPDIGFYNKATKKNAVCWWSSNNDSYMMTKLYFHEVIFVATENKHEYIIKTHGCGGDDRCVATYKKNENESYVYHNILDNVLHETDFEYIWHFDLSDCDSRRCYYFIRPADNSVRSWYGESDIRLSENDDNKALWYFSGI
ncbi:Oidioi.mRNA.OKI2018_I69.chr2.g4988.t1.cds [Oikopleura dioica]|uniref:Oidioi.mRNA.OKI2018_I69.chr2.g4988.t1.cds n=1 Tax=Oikopleura dioica TaxID=34765 RepID=A0ABN7T2S6_OIKDI|nr:Oidioi.mRNA.OKI2018_I69.chr2.g4988.t1.cds [Oikopleura dioica]